MLSLHFHAQPTTANIKVLDQQVAVYQIFFQLLCTNLPFYRLASHKGVSYAIKVDPNTHHPDRVFFVPFRPFTNPSSLPWSNIYRRTLFKLIWHSNHLSWVSGGTLLRLIGIDVALYQSPARWIYHSSISMPLQPHWHCILINRPQCSTTI